jgi:ferric-dicitrate binding protein FerR (iron transport regulator)
MATAKGQLCARSREWASLRADAELSELEAALLDAHLARCEDCRAFAASLDAIVISLRRAPAERLAPIELRVPRRHRRVLPALVAAGLVIVAAVVGSLAGVAGRDSSPSPSTQRGAIAVVASVETPDQLRRLRRTVLLDSRKIPRNLSGETA